MCRTAAQSLSYFSTTLFLWRKNEQKDGKKDNKYKRKVLSLRRKTIKNMEKLDLQAIADSRLNFHWNDHIAIFSDFEELRSLNISDVLIEGFLFAVVTHGQAQISVDDKMYQLKEGDLITCKPRNIFEKSMMSMDFNALVLFLSPEYVAQLS